MGKRNFDLMSRNEIHEKKYKEKWYGLKSGRLDSIVKNHYAQFMRSLPLLMISGILGKKKKQKISGVHKSYF